MGVSIYYTAERATVLTAAERAEVDRIATAWNAAFPFDYEVLFFYGEVDEPGAILQGSVKLSPEVEELMPSLAHWCAALTELRRAVPDAHWRVHVDDEDIPWDEAGGYGFPGM